MPYIVNQQHRRILNSIIKVYFEYLTTNGNLNYLLFSLAKKTCHRYNDYKAFIGELECAKAEIYRKQVAPYEEQKEKENGKVNLDD